jgi:hypothetical protein
LLPRFANRDRGWSSLEQRTHRSRHCRQHDIDAEFTGRRLDILRRQKNCRCFECGTRQGHYSSRYKTSEHFRDRTRTGQNSGFRSGENLFQARSQRFLKHHRNSTSPNSSGFRKSKNGIPASGTARMKRSQTWQRGSCGSSYRSGLSRILASLWTEERY